MGDKHGLVGTSLSQELTPMDGFQGALAGSQSKAGLLRIEMIQRGSEMERAMYLMFFKWVKNSVMMFSRLL